MCVEVSRYVLLCILIFTLFIVAISSMGKRGLIALLIVLLVMYVSCCFVGLFLCFFLWVPKLQQKYVLSDVKRLTEHIALCTEYISVVNFNFVQIMF